MKSYLKLEKTIMKLKYYLNKIKIKLKVIK